MWACFFQSHALWEVCIVPVFLCLCLLYFSFLSGPVCLMWILGNSYVHWGAQRALIRPDSRQMGFSRADATVRWIGIPGMLWSRVLPEIQQYAHLDRPPDVLLLQIRGNDLCLRASRDLIHDVKWDFLWLYLAFPATILVWSDIIGRLTWRGARSVNKINKARVKVNKAVPTFLLCNGGASSSSF